MSDVCIIGFFNLLRVIDFVSVAATKSPHIDGQWCNWSPFSDCSVPCGGGEMTRLRFCNNPAPENGGANCEGPNEETEKCGEEACPSK